MNYNNHLFFLTLILLNNPLCAQKRTLIIFISIDQFGQSALSTIIPHCTGGLKALYDQSSICTQMYMPHAKPSTAPGHATLMTGCYPSTHGIVGNGWCNQDGIFIGMDDTNDPNSAVINPNGGIYNYGKNINALRVETLTDQFKIAHARNCRTICVGQKSRSVLCINGKLGLPIWFDEKTGKATSSKAFCFQLPDWLVKHNKETKTASSFEWTLQFNEDNPAYATAQTSVPDGKESSLCNTILSQKNHSFSKDPYNWFFYTPDSNRWVIDVAQAGLAAALEENINNIFIGICLGQPDKMGHKFGQDSYEFLDSMYKIDFYLKPFIDRIMNLTNKYHVVIVVTADHSCMPISEQLNNKIENNSFAHRANTKNMRTELNSYLKQKFQVNEIVARISVPDLYFHRTNFQRLSKIKQKAIRKETKLWLRKHPLIENVWNPYELKTTHFSKGKIGKLFQNQMYKDRSGDLIFQIIPYAYVGRHNKGVSHNSPYRYDRHISYFLFDSQNPLQKFVHTECCATQSVATIAQLINIPLPSAACAQPAFVHEVPCGLN